MIQKKVVLLGAPGVGKTSLVRRFVESLFDDAYFTTIGVKVDKKTIAVNGQDVTLMLWDIAGGEEQFSVPPSYVRGASGYLLVADGTRPDTLSAGIELVDTLRSDLATTPGVLVLNKADRHEDWRVDDADVARFTQAGTVVRTSARTGAGVDDTFRRLAEALVE